jgi:hypothetical protein
MKILLFCLISIALSLPAKCQNYLEIPADSTSEWRVLRSEAEGLCLHNRDFKYFFNGDTIIDSKIYHKLYQSGFYQETEIGPPSPGCDDYFVFENVYVAGIRNENGKVFSREPWGEDLIYDYTLQVGDFVITAIAGTGTQVVSIDSVLVGNEYRRRFNVSNPLGRSYWIIEGLGHETGLIEPMYSPLYFYSELYCYAENNVAIFPEGSNCDLAVNIHEYEETNITLSISPNPASNKVNISVNCNVASKIHLRIISSTGRIIVNRFWKLNSGDNEYSIDLASLTPGIYIVMVIDGNNIIHKKLMLTK